MATIPIYGRAGVVAHTIVDEADVEAFGHLRLNLGRGGYAVHYRTIDGRLHAYKLHRTILSAPAGSLVDHINRDPLDNRRANLRLCTISENGCNRPADRLRNRTGFKGVSHNGYSYQAVIQIARKSRYLGSFHDPVAAARAYDEAAKRLHGAFAYINFPEAA